jgi:hypothetical protein
VSPTLTARRLSTPEHDVVRLLSGERLDPDEQPIVRKSCADDDRLAPGLGLARDGQWVEEQQATAVVDRVGRDQRGGSRAVNLLTAIEFRADAVAARVMPHTGATAAECGAYASFKPLDRRRQQPSVLGCF